MFPTKESAAPILSTVRQFGGTRVISDFLAKYCKVSDLTELSTTLVRYPIRMDPQTTTLIELN